MWSPSLDTSMPNDCTPSATRWAAGHSSWPSGRAPGLFESLFLFEPITFPDDVATDGQNMMGDAARRRRPVFASSAEVLARYASRPPFNQVRAGFLAAYVENGFAEQPDGSVRLKCAPEVEATVFENGRAAKLSAVRHVTTPTAVAVGHDEEGPNPARLGPPLADALVNGHLVRYDHIGHFGPLQDPWTIARDLKLHVACAGASRRQLNAAMTSPNRVIDAGGAKSVNQM